MISSSKRESQVNRRAFVTSSLASAGLLMTHQQAHGKGFVANETLNLAGIGCGGRFRHLAKSVVKVPNVKLVALCDVNQKNLAAASKDHPQTMDLTKHADEILARKDIDGVIIATPDHWHVPMLIKALQAGKHAYCEKPLTHDLSEGVRLRDERSAHPNPIVQIGMQQRSMPHIIAGKKLVTDGALGEIRKVRLNWNRNAARHVRKSNLQASDVDWKMFLGSAKDQPFDGYRCEQWRWFWDFGGGVLTDLMVHWMDVVEWYLDLGEPTAAGSLGTFHNADGVWETPDTIQTMIDYAKRKIQVHFEGGFSNANRAASVEFLGTKASLYVDRGRYEFIPEDDKKEAQSMILGSGKRGADFYTNPDGELLHLTDWVNSIRANRQPSTPIEAGIRAVWAPHLGNLAYRQQALAKWPGKG